MGRNGNWYAERYSRRELKQRKIRVLAYFLLITLAVVTVTVALVALRR